MKGRHGIMPACNAQEMVSPVTGFTGNGMLITAAEVVNTAADSGQLIQMLEKSEEMTGERSPLILADGVYHTAANPEAGGRQGALLVMPERNHAGLQGAYTNFVCKHRVSALRLAQGERRTGCVIPVRGDDVYAITPLRVTLQASLQRGG